MHSAGSLGSNSTGHEEAELVCHLAHELRQPLSGIEASAYYIDMLASEARPELIPYCRRLRRMVQQASWLLDDASLSACFRPEPRRTFPLAEICAQAAARLLAEEEAVLDLHLSGPLPPVVAPEPLPRLVDHILSFFRDAAGCPGPIHLRLEADARLLTATWWCDACEDPEEAARMAAPGGGCGYLQRFARAAGGTLRAEASSGRLLVALTLPVAAEQGREFGV
ncbi:MAG: hypothetical protein N2036_14990 [Bryobacteraceae bacterium]|nr:hypothetical protein [Bryobacteraceae bacterium]